MSLAGGVGEDGGDWCDPKADGDCSDAVSVIKLIMTWHWSVVVRAGCLHGHAHQRVRRLPAGPVTNKSMTSDYAYTLTFDGNGKICAMSKIW